ncbi:MAG: hypothetical protein EOO67_09840 [Microbacterium sp.]|nr:MAG: hypothetical protein EOO67_09840 [Microbacterium sp.]
MIVLTRLNRSRFAVNPDLIERIQATPDTTLIMVDGATFVVAETMDAVIGAVVAFRARVLSAALDASPPGDVAAAPVDPTAAPADPALALPTRAEGAG